LINADLGVDGKLPSRERFELKPLAEIFNVANTPHHTTPGATSSTATNSNNSISSGTFMQATEIANVGREGIDERTVRFSLKLTW